jgi:cation:H+ antiporter
VRPVRSRAVTYVLLLASFAVLLSGALLFTNAVEWLGHRLHMGQGAVGSLLAAVATALPESIIPVVALIGGAEGAEEVAIGAIIGAPFLLGTIAMALVGTSAFLYRRRRPQGLGLSVHVPTLRRDLTFFLVFFTLGVLLGLGAPEGVEYVAAAIFVVAYGVYVRWTLTHGGAVQEEETLNPLILDLDRRPNPPILNIAVQLVVALGAIVGGAHLFVHELLEVADRFGVSPLVLALVLAPLATELPEKANSFFWVREGKDTLALGNITGAMVFQSTLPVAIGLAFTHWELGTFSLLAAGLGITGGLLAIWSLQVRQRFNAVAVTIWGLLWVAFVVTVVVAS